MAEAQSITNYRITNHARDEMARRQVTEDDVAKVLAAPEQSETVREGRKVYQSRLQSGEPPSTYLLRVFGWRAKPMGQQLDCCLRRSSTATEHGLASHHFGALTVFVDLDRRLPEVVTVYRTSKVAKYWRTKP